MDITRSAFPESFVWGVATAAYQVEGAAETDGRTPSIWDTFSHTPGMVDNGDTGDVAADHYTRFLEDIDLMDDLGVTAYRFSISWSRLVPDGLGQVNQAAVDWYRGLCSELLNRGIEPVATLYHWDLPQILQDRGGWANSDSVGWFAAYTAVAKEHLGDLVQTWTTFNEPWCTAFLGYSLGVHAPGHSDAAEAFLVAHHLMLAHHEAVRVLRSVSHSPKDRVGIVLNLIPAWPDDDSNESKTAAAGVDAVQNRLFAGAVTSGVYPKIIMDIHASLGLDELIDYDALENAVQAIDFLGVNYYNINHIEHVEDGSPLGDWPGIPEVRLATPPGHLTEMGWGVEPIGLRWMLDRITQWDPDLKIMIMENGAAYPDVVAPDGRIHDELRTAYLQAHIEAVHDAMQDGANVTGFFVWSLLDNFEWSLGYEKRFGIVRVDFTTLERTVKDSGLWYRDFLQG